MEYKSGRIGDFYETFESNIVKYSKKEQNLHCSQIYTPYNNNEKNLYDDSFDINAYVNDSPTNFFEQQLKFPRVQTANREKGKAVSDLLSSKNINASSFDLFLRAFKKEQKLEVWAKNKSDNTFTLLKTYEFCATTGVLCSKTPFG